MIGRWISGLNARRPPRGFHRHPKGSDMNEMSVSFTETAKSPDGFSGADKLTIP